MPKATTSKQTDTPGRTKVGDWLGTQLGTVLVPSSSAYVPSQTTGEQVAKKKTRTPKKTPKSKETIENEPGDEEYFSSTQYQSILFDLTNETEVAPAPVTLRDPAFLGYCYFQPLLDEGWGGPEGTTLVKAATGRPLSVAGAKGLWNQIGPNNLKRDLPEFSLAIAVPKGLIKESCLKQDLASGEQWDTAEFDEAFQGERVIHFISGQHRIWCLKRYIGPLLLDAWEKTRAYKAAFEKDGVAKIPEDKQANYDMLRKRMLSPKHTWLVRVYDYTNLMGTDDGAVRMLGLTHNNVTAAQVDAPVWQLRNAAVTKNLTPKEPAAMLKFFTGVGDKSSNLVQALIQRHSDVLEFMCELQPHRHFDLMTKTTPKKLGEMTLNGSWGAYKAFITGSINQFKWFTSEHLPFEEQTGAKTLTEMQWTHRIARNIKKHAPITSDQFVATILLEASEKAYVNHLGPAYLDVMAAYNSPVQRKMYQEYRVELMQLLGDAIKTVETSQEAEHGKPKLKAMLNKVRAALFLGVTSNANMVPGNFTKPRDPTFTMAATPLLCRSFADQLLEFMDKTHVMWQTVAFMIVPGLNEHSGQRNAAIPYDEHNVPVPFPSAMCLVREHLCYWAFYKKKKTDWQRMTLNKIRAKHVGFDERVDMVFNRIIWLALSHRATGFPDADLANIAATIALPRGDAAMRDWLGENPQDKGDLLDEKALRSEVMELHKTIKDRVNTRDELEQRGNGKRFKLKNLDQIFPREVGKFALASPEVARALKWSHLNWFVVGGNNRKTAVERIVKNMIFCVYVMRDKVEPLVEGNLSRRLMRHKIFAAIQGATMLTSWEPWWDWPENDTDQAEIVLGQTELRAAEKEMKLFAAQMEKRFCTRVWGAVPNENGKDAMHPGVTVAYHNLLTEIRRAQRDGIVVRSPGMAKAMPHTLEEWVQPEKDLVWTDLPVKLPRTSTFTDLASYLKGDPNPRVYTQDQWEEEVDAATTGPTLNPVMPATLRAWTNVPTQPFATPPPPVEVVQRRKRATTPEGESHPEDEPMPGEPTLSQSEDEPMPQKKKSRKRAGKAERTSSQAVREEDAMDVDEDDPIQTPLDEAGDEDDIENDDEKSSSEDEEPVPRRKKRKVDTEDEEEDAAPVDAAGQDDEDEEEEGAPGDAAGQDDEDEEEDEAPAAPAAQDDEDDSDDSDDSDDEEEEDEAPAAPVAQGDSDSDEDEDEEEEDEAPAAPVAQGDSDDSEDEDEEEEDEAPPAPVAQGDSDDSEDEDEDGDGWEPPPASPPLQDEDDGPTHPFIDNEAEESDDEGSGKKSGDEESDEAHPAPFEPGESPRRKKKKSHHSVSPVHIRPLGVRSSVPLSSPRASRSPSPSMVALRRKTTLRSSSPPPGNQAQLSSSSKKKKKKRS